LDTELWDLLLRKQLTTCASWVTFLQDMEHLTVDLSRWQLHPEFVVSDRFGLRHANKAYALAAGANTRKGTMVPSDDLDD
jgi:threonine dehydrogenase-like Zn-dependent dehydrogenase